MANRLELGIRLPVHGPLSGAAAISTVARRAEELGYDALWVSDFVDWNRDQDRKHLACGSADIIAEDQPPIFHESLTNLAYVAGITSRIRLGVALLCLPYRNPIVAARQVANIDVLSNGRLILGVGPGASIRRNNRNFAVLGVPWARKFDRMTDYFKAMVAIWTQPISSYQGEFISFPEAEFYPKPVQSPYPPIWGGGRMPKSLDFVAEFATGWLPGWVAAEDYPAKIRQIHDLAAAKGRGDVDFMIGTEVYALIDRTHEGAYEKSRKTVEVLRHGFQNPPPEEKIRRSMLVGSPEEVLGQVARLVDNGVQHFHLKVIYQSIEHLLDQMQMFREEVFSAFAPACP